MNYRILCVELYFYLPYTHSLKEKRALRQKLLDRLKGHFKASVMECGEQENRARLEAAAVVLTADEKSAGNCGRALVDYAEECLMGEAELTDYKIEIL